jgi:hypothetical protein
MVERLCACSLGSYLQDENLGGESSEPLPKMDQPRSCRDLSCRDLLANAAEPASKAKRPAGAEPCLSPRPEKRMKNDSRELSASPVLRAAGAEKEVGEAGKPKEVPRIASAGEAVKEGKRTAQQEANSTCPGVLAAASAELASAVAKSAGDGPASGLKSSSSDGAAAGTASRRPDKGTCQGQTLCEKSASSPSSAGAPRATRSSARQSSRDDGSKSPEKRRR